MKLQAFSKVPSALNLPFIGTMHQYFPVIGTYTGIKLHHENYDKYQKLGQIFKETFTANDPVLLHLFDANDFEKVFRNESQNPSRYSHVALQHYRMKNNSLYNTGGLLPTNGSEWWKLRKAFQKDLSSPKIVLQYLNCVDNIANEWIEHLQKNVRENKMHPDFLLEFWIIFLEMAGMILFDHRFNTFSSKIKKENPLALVEAALCTNHNTVFTDIGYKMWKIFDLKAYKEIKEAQNYMEKITQCLIKNLSPNNNCLVSKWLKIETINEKDVLAMAIDFFLAGIDTSANTSSFLFYYVATHKDVQDKLYNECFKLLNNANSNVDEEILFNAKYAKAVIKETLRLRPVSIGVGRLLTKDIVLRNYLIPRGVNVLTNNQVACRLEQNFHKPLDFIPERWLRSDPLYQQCHPFLLLPFGYGTRACIARRLAEQNMLTILIKVIRNFEVFWKGPELDSNNHLIQKPDQPLQFVFVPRK